MPNDNLVLIFHNHAPVWLLDNPATFFDPFLALFLDVLKAFWPALGAIELAVAIL